MIKRSKRLSLRYFLDVLALDHLFSRDIEYLVKKLDYIAVVGGWHEISLFAVVYMSQSKQSVFALNFVEIDGMLIQHEIKLIANVCVHLLVFCNLVHSADIYISFFYVNRYVFFVLTCQKFWWNHNDNFFPSLCVVSCNEKTNEWLALPSAKLKCLLRWFSVN